MKISEHIAKMLEIMAKEGDLEVMSWPYDCIRPADVRSIEIREDLKKEKVVMIGDD